MLSAARRRAGYSSPEYFLEQYRAGRFLYVGRWGGTRWIDPAQRAVIPLDDRQTIPKDVARLKRRGDFEIRFDTAFADVLRHCATVQGRATGEDPWLTPDAREAYLHLHDLGFAHSTEAWRDGRLVGGEFGMSINGMYSTESLFYLESNASKVAFAHLLERLRSRGFLLHDTQVVSNLTRPFGAYLIPRSQYHDLLTNALAADVAFR